MVCIVRAHSKPPANRPPWRRTQRAARDGRRRSSIKLGFCVTLRLRQINWVGRMGWRDFFKVHKGNNGGCVPDHQRSARGIAGTFAHIAVAFRYARAKARGAGRTPLEAQALVPKHAHYRRMLIGLELIGAIDLIAKSFVREFVLHGQASNTLKITSNGMHMRCRGAFLWTRGSQTRPSELFPSGPSSNLTCRAGAS